MNTRLSVKTNRRRVRPPAPAGSHPGHFAVALLAAGALIALAAGCGGGDDQPLTKAEVIKQGSAICKAAEKKVYALPQLTTKHPFAKGTSPAERQRARRFLTGYANALDGSRDSLAGLNAPEQDRQLLDGYIHDIGIVADKLRAASEAAPQDVEARANQAFALFYRASKQTAEYGFPKGVCGAGSSG